MLAVLGDVVEPRLELAVGGGLQVAVEPLWDVPVVERPVRELGGRARADPDPDIGTDRVVAGREPAAYRQVASLTGPVGVERVSCRAIGVGEPFDPRDHDRASEPRSVPRGLVVDTSCRPRIEREPGFAAQPIRHPG
jgi:hypothetical protein